MSTCPHYSIFWYADEWNCMPSCYGTHCKAIMFSLFENSPGLDVQGLILNGKYVYLILQVNADGLSALRTCHNKYPPTKSRHAFRDTQICCSYVKISYLFDPIYVLECNCISIDHRFFSQYIPCSFHLVFHFWKTIECDDLLFVHLFVFCFFHWILNIAFSTLPLL